MIELALEYGHQGLVYQGGFAAAGHSADAHEAAQREIHIYVFQVVAAGSLQSEETPAAGTAPLRNGHSAAELSGRTTVAEFAALLPRSRANVHYPVGGEHGLFVVLDHNHRVALVAQFPDGSEQLAVVLLVKAYGRLVEYVDYVHQPGAYLGGEAYALALSSGQGGGRAVEGEVLQAHVQQELHPVAEFLEHIVRDGGSLAAELAFQGVNPGLELGHFHRAYLGYSPAVDLEAVGLFAKAGAVTDGAYHLLVYVIHHSRPGNHLCLKPFAYTEIIIRAEDQKAHGLVRQFLNRVVKGESELSGYGADYFELAGLTELAQRHDTAVRYTFAAVGDDCVHVDIHYHPEALAMRAVAFRGIEGEAVRSRVAQGHSAFRVYQML